MITETGKSATQKKWDEVFAKVRVMLDDTLTKADGRIEELDNLLNAKQNDRLAQHLEGLEQRLQRSGTAVEHTEQAPPDSGISVDIPVDTDGGPGDPEGPSSGLEDATLPSRLDMLQGPADFAAEPARALPPVAAAPSSVEPVTPHVLPLDVAIEPSTSSVPPLMVVVPVKVLVPLSVSVPAVRVSPPVPPMMPA